MRPHVIFLLCNTLLLSQPMGIICPFAPCGSLIWINKLVESPELQWIFYDIPGHPVPDCPYADPKDAPPGLRSIFLRPLSHPDSAPKELFRAMKYMINKALPRVLRRMFFAILPKGITQRADNHASEL
uniref:Secreted protein n=2 Tax=Lepeophtheirus salmonis TaxID=72036 RepID=A0A0K2UIM2_LEPSM